TGKFFDNIIGGWYASGIVTLFSGLPLTVTESSQTFGGATSTIGVNSAMIPTSALTNANVNSGSAGCTLTGTGSVGSPAAGSGSGLNMFANPCAVYAGVRYIQLSSDTRTGRANPLRGLPVRNFDLRFAKDTKITEKTRLGFSADLFNVFNHHNFNNGS